MKKGKCIYCKKEKDLNEEHAFPKHLLQKGVCEWVIDKHLCVTCNSRLAKLDASLIKEPTIAFTSDRIQDELGNKTQTLHSSIYHKKAVGINPVRLFTVDPLYGNRILLHEIVTVRDDIDGPIDSRTALRPQMILMQYPEGQNSAEIITENCEKFNIVNLDENIILNYDGQEEIYCIFGNTYIFPPKTTERFFRKAAEFKSKFMRDVPRIQYDLTVIYPKKGGHRCAAETFCESLKAGTKEIIEDEKIPNPKSVTQLIEVRGDQKAIPVIARGIAKIAFHCFLYHYPKFSGHESIFDDIREFIYTGSSNRFVTQWQNTETENCIYDSTKHFHIIDYFVQKDDIGCRIDFFTGLQNPPISYQVILTGKPENLNPSPGRTECIPFYVHPKSQMKKRILTVENLGIMQQPSPYEGVLWLPKHLL